MANIGEVTEVINATKVHLDLGSNRHILLQDLQFHIGRPESRESTDTGSLYFFGNSDDYFDATLLLSSPELSTYVGYTVLDANGALPSNAFKLIYTDKSGTSKTLTVTCSIPSLDIDKPVEGGTKTRMRFRITQNVTTSDIS